MLTSTSLPTSDICNNDTTSSLGIVVIYELSLALAIDKYNSNIICLSISKVLRYI